MGLGGGRGGWILTRCPRLSGEEERPVGENGIGEPEDWSRPGEPEVAAAAAAAADDGMAVSIPVWWRDPRNERLVRLKPDM